MWSCSFRFYSDLSLAEYVLGFLIQLSKCWEHAPRLEPGSTPELKGCRAWDPRLDLSMLFLFIGARCPPELKRCWKWILRLDM
ncbi:hypothetical protein D5086_012894 [Populus alba]|uniref:Uncharacterized protein n=1 Tax=Populus alba TaxID=43335 RepID=A0ACC4C468_POPAL